MLNLLSDESDEEQDGEHVYSPCCRNGLYIAQTKLAGSDGGRLPFRGLFASKSLCVGAFVGFYTGDWYTPEKLESMPDVRRRNEYAVSTSGDARCDEIICSKGRISPLPNDSVPRISTDYNRSTPVTCYH